jgi:hypothetical protein
MDFNSKVKKLADTTTSPEVRSLCESFLSENTSGGNFYEALNSVKGQDEASRSFLMEGNNLWNEIKDREMEVSKKAAASLLESWSNKTTSSNAGTWITNSKIEEDRSQKLNESLSKISDDKATSSFLTAQSIKNLGVLESVNNLLGSSIAEHASVKILLENYKNILGNNRIPEYSVIDNFISDLKGVCWDSNAKSIYENLLNTRNKFEREIYVSSVIDALKNSGSREFYSDLYESLNEWMISPDKSNGLLVNQIQKFGFNPVVRNLINFLNLNESKRDTSKLSIPEVNQTESFVSRVYSPVGQTDNSFAFQIGKTIFEADEESVKKITAKKAAEKYGVSFVNLLEISNMPNVRIDESGVHFSIGKKTIKISEGSDETPSVYLGKTKLNFRNVSEMAKLIGLEVSSVSGYNDMQTVNMVATVFENFNSIVELDFAKSVISRIYEGLSVNIFKWNSQLYLQRVNEAMRENSVFSVTSTQAVKLVKESLRYDISEGLTEFLDGELRTKSILVNDRSEIISNIQKIEEQISKVEYAMQQTALSASPELKEAHIFLQRELKILRNKWSAINEEIDRIENESLEITDLNEDNKFNIGDYVKIKESGETGKIISIDGTSGSITVLTDSGRTEDHRIDEISDLEEALNKAAEENQESAEDSDDSAEEMKESKNPMAKAPAKAKKNNEKPQQPSLVSAPGKTSDKPMAKDLKNPKAANYAEGVDGEKPTEFEVTGYEIGYNLDEAKNGEANVDSQNLAATPGSSKRENLHDKNGLDAMAKGHSFSKAPGKKESVSFKLDDAHGYRSIQEATKGEVSKSDPNLAVAPSTGKDAPATGKGADDQNLAEAPGKWKDKIDFGVNSEIGYNLDEASLEKKN